MVRIIGTPNFTFDGKMIVDYSGSSTDTKPTENVGDGWEPGVYGWEKE